MNEPTLDNQVVNAFTLLAVDGQIHLSIFGQEVVQELLKLEVVVLGADESQDYLIATDKFKNMLLPYTELIKIYKITRARYTHTPSQEVVDLLIYISSRIGLSLYLTWKNRVRLAQINEDYKQQIDEQQEAYRQRSNLMMRTTWALHKPKAEGNIT